MLCKGNRLRRISKANSEHFLELGQIDSMSADEGARLNPAPSFESNQMYFHSFYDCTSSEYVQQIDLPFS